MSVGTNMRAGNLLHRGRIVAAAIAVLLVGAVIGLWTDQSSVSGSRAAVAAPTLAADLDATGRVSWQAPMVLRLHGGQLLSVVATDAGGAPLPGAIQAGAKEWHSTSQLLPDTTYALTAHIVDDGDHGRVRSLKATTTPPRLKISATITPGDGNVVGVGMPVVVRFDHPVPQTARSAMVGRLAVVTSPAVTGAWRWLTPSELHWRPENYWPAHTAVTATADLDRLNLGDGSWGTGRHSSTFSVGDAHVSTADASTHTMTVTNNGQVVRTLPMSAGRQEYPSHSGVHVALSKNESVVMDSATVGIPRNSPDGYYETVAWDVRISYGGEFVHAAPWSAAAQGQRNVSHGCINLSTADAQWFYGFTQRGDIINVLNAGAKPNLADPGTADWNLSWSAWTQPGLP
jgi:lipoprotein-anchoring transpeptidase ErfK/SrfK